jgi:deoxyribose-phosphate aldolase
MSVSPELVARLDAALWHPAASARDVETLCTGAVAKGLRAVCVNSSRVSLAASRLDDSDVKIVSLVAFPFGAVTPDTKRFETEAAIDDGAQEIELVLNPAWFKDGADALVLREIRDIAEVIDERPLGVVLEHNLLTAEELQRGFTLARESGPDVVVVGTGFWPGAAPTLDKVKQWQEWLGPKMRLKVNGVADATQAEAWLKAGAFAIGVPGLPSWL